MGILALTLSLGAWCAAMDVDAVIARNVDAHGGLQRLHAVQSVVIKSTYTDGSFRCETVHEVKRPDRVRNETHIQGMAEVQAYDGKTGWKVSPFGGRRDPDLLSADDLKQMIEDSDIDGPLVDYRSKGHQAELLGQEPVEGTACWKVRMRLKDGNVKTYYIDTDSGLEIKIESQDYVRGTLRENETWLGDYEAVDGIQFPYEVDVCPRHSQKRGHLTVEKVTVNASLDDSLFALPGGSTR